jgi:hypothetical protein
MRPDLTEVLRKPIPVWELRLFECDDDGYQCHPAAAEHESAIAEKTVEGK